MSSSRALLLNNMDEVDPKVEASVGLKKAIEAMQETLPAPQLALRRSEQVGFPQTIGLYILYCSDLGKQTCPKL